MYEIFIVIALNILLFALFFICPGIADVDMKKYYNNLKNRGKESKVALTAVMRKIIITWRCCIKSCELDVWLN